MRGFISLGIIIWLIYRFFEQKYIAKKTYAKFSNFISANKSNWEKINEEIIQKHDITSLNDILIRENDIYLITKEASVIKTQMLSNGRMRQITEVQYMGILRKFGDQNMFYTFNIDTSSIYYHFCPPYENYILWIYIA